MDGEGGSDGVVEPVRVVGRECRPSLGFQRIGGEVNAGNGFGMGVHELHVGSGTDDQLAGGVVGGENAVDDTGSFG